MSLHDLLHSPLFEGTSGGSAEVPGKWMVALAGRGFMVDLNSGDFRRQSIPLLRQQADQSSQPGESSINPDDLWRRTIPSWHKGAGQRNYDAADSDPFRFYSSKGVDPWTREELKLQHDTVESLSSAETNLRLAVAGSRLYATVGTSIRYTTDLSSWSDVTGEPATAASAITSDGYTVWSAHGADGIYSTARDSGSTSSYAAGTVAGVKYIKGRLFAWQGDKFYNVVTNSLPAALLDHPNADFAWVDVAEGNGFYFPAGYSGDKSIIYKTAVKADGTGLDVPTVAAELPDGEVVRAIQGYLGFVLVGTDKGIRFGIPDDAGDITLGDLITQPSEVRCFEGQESFVWFGWSNYDAVSTGLGRIDLGSFVGSRPSWASDLMVTGQGAVLSVATFLDRRVLTVSGDGIYAEDPDTYVPEGVVETGRISYGLNDPKVSQVVTVAHSALSNEDDDPASVGMELARNGGSFSSIGGVNTTDGSVRSDFPTGRARGEHFELRLTITPDLDADPMVSPIVRRVTLKSDPTAPRSERIFVPLIISNGVRDITGTMVERDARADLEFLAGLEETADSFLYQEASLGFTVTAADHDWRPMFLPDGQPAFNGTYLIQLKKFATE